MAPSSILSIDNTSFNVFLRDDNYNDDGDYDNDDGDNYDDDDNDDENLLHIKGRRFKMHCTLLDFIH
jgi:hypothetical protein